MIVGFVSQEYQHFPSHIPEKDQNLNLTPKKYK